MATILVVDDEIGIRELLSEILDDEGHEVLLAENAAKARLHYAQQAIDLVLLDIWMPDTDGMTLLREWASASVLRSHIVMMSGHASIDTAIEAQNLGAVGFLEKPITLHKLLGTVHKVLRKDIKRFEHNITPVNDTIPETSSSNQDKNINQPSGNYINNILNVNSNEPASIEAVNTLNNITELPPLSIWQEALANTPLDTGLREFRETVERVYFNYILEREHWSMIRVAEAAGLERTHLYRKLKQLNIELPRKIKLSEN
jgi:DNA-binding NtrC family response regulator